ncbi:hypothetical protein D6C78_10492 [Aureobasidium pullulans]|uniref:NACHT domain-containing protein n=1 Tax=Aureobasidium pullulans TaxID=5580 RepID=A0A4T0B4D5_AURPU|nr:hypothetical protein D6C78_10492 [Aureobasidium pullulans]
MPQARVMTVFGYDTSAVHLAAATSQNSIFGHVENLLVDLKNERRTANAGTKPLIFVGHSLGGLLGSIGESTLGVIFLATPHRGSDKVRFADVIYKAAKLTGNLPNDHLLNALRKDSDVLEAQRASFATISKEMPIKCIYEELATMRHMIVEESSAVIDGFHVRKASIQADHIAICKFDSPDDGGYKKVKNFLLDMYQEGPWKIIREADAWIRDRHYTTEHLEITRLSGSPLPMDRCYINLTLVDQNRRRLDVDPNGEEKKSPSSSSPFSLEARLSIQTPRKEDLIKLQTLFDEREQPDGIKLRPRRILIRGRAGVGKTTLCKKIVHDFITEGLWQGLFQRVIWVPLRDLKTMPKPYTLDGMLREIFFWEGPSRDSLAGALARCIDENQSRDTLFLLDGLDEVAEIVMERRNGPSHDARRFLLGLLNRPNVLITARPQAEIPHGCQRPDMDLDTIGFGVTEVEEYIDTVVVDHEDAMAIKTYLRKNQLMQSLVRIPIQLDALCFTWKDDSHDQNSTMEEIPRTMTSIYTAITQKLWIKDIERYPKPGYPLLENPLPTEIANHTSEECDMLGKLAFSGLRSNVIEFQERHREALLKSLVSRRSNVSLATMFGNMSFLRSSNPHDEIWKQSYHFIHLTFQEYFAAKYFVERWEGGKDLECIDLDSKRYGRSKISCEEFLQQHKYDVRYHIMWGFVVGLMNDDGSDEGVERFLQAVEQEPIDLLGPAHQRLVMHCLSQAVFLPANFIQSDYDQRLKRWVLFEVDLLGASYLVEEPNFPARILGLTFHSFRDDERKLLLLNSLRLANVHLSEPILTAVAGNPARSRDLRIAAIKTIGRQSSLPKSALVEVARLLRDEVPDGRRAAVKAIGQQSSLSESTLVEVARLLGDEDRYVRYAAVKTIGKQSSLPESILVEVARLLDDEEPHIQHAAVWIIGKQSSLLEPILVEVARLLRDEDGDLRYAAVEAIGKRSSLPESTLVEVIRLFRDKDRHVQGAAVEAIGKQSSLSESTLVEVIKLLGDKDRYVRSAAVKIIGQQLSLPEPTLVEVRRLLSNKDSAVRRAAIRTLGKQSSLPESTLVEVIRLLRDEDRYVRRVAVEAIGKQSSLPDQNVRRKGYNQFSTVQML